MLEYTLSRLTGAVALAGRRHNALGILACSLLFSAWLLSEKYLFWKTPSPFRLIGIESNRIDCTDSQYVDRNGNLDDTWTRVKQNGEEVEAKPEPEPWHRRSKQQQHAPCGPRRRRSSSPTEPSFAARGGESLDGYI